MKARYLAIAVLGIGVLAVLAQEQSASPGVRDAMIPCQPIRHLAYITVTDGVSERVTVLNPRADNGEVFYITDIILNGHSQTYAVADIYFPTNGD